MKAFDTRAYNILDFNEWNENGQLILSPDFQRRAVWNTKAKSYLVDTVLRGMPMPKIIITQALVDGKNVRTVVDGQQRLRALLDYINDGFTVSKLHNEQYGGLVFSALPDFVQQEVLQYELGVDVLFNQNTADILDIFSRLNTYSVKLNSTELLNAQYLGAFKTFAHQVARQYVQYWLDSKILTSSNVARMSEVELTGDLLIALLDGIHAKKSIPAFYKKYDEIPESSNEYSNMRNAIEAFHATMQNLLDIYAPEEIALTNYRRVHLYYTLFCVIASIRTNCLKTNLEIESPHSMPNNKLRIFFDNFSATYDEKIDSKEPSSDWNQFIQDSRRATTDQATRIRRWEFILRQLKDYANNE